MKQQTPTGFEKYGKTTRRAKFLADLDRIIPWPEMTAAVATVYPKINEQGGRPPIPLERMLRIYFLQLWFNLSDPAVEEELYDSAAMRSFVGIDLGVEGAPDETTICKFRHLLERNKLGKTLLRAVNEHLHRNGIKISNGTIVHATIIGAPSSTKNKESQARSGDAPSSEGQAVVLRHEGACRGRQQDEADSHNPGIGRERVGRGCAALSAARSRDARVGRSRLPRANGGVDPCYPDSRPGPNDCRQPSA